MIPMVMSIIAKTETFQRDMARTRATVGKFDKSVGRTAATVKKMGRSMLTMAGVGGGLYLISNMLRNGVREAAAFEKQMAMVSTMLDDQSMSIMPRYERQIRAMSKEFGEGTETLSKGLYDILSASIAQDKALKVLAVSTKAAKAGMTDTGVAADAITTILNSYSLEAERAGDVSDKLFAIVKRGKTTFADLAPNIGKVAALAATAGLSFDDMGATLATMTRAGIQTEIAITSLRAIILSFLKPQADSIEMARQYGVELNSNTLRTIGLTGVMQKLKKATAEELAVIVPTSRAITGFAATIQNSDEVVGDYDFVLNSLGQTEEAYQKIAETSAFKLAQLNKEWVDLKRVIGDLTTGPLIGFLGAVKRHLEDWSRFVLETKEGLIDIAQLLRLMDRPIEFGGGGGGRFGGYGATGGWESTAGEAPIGVPIKAPGAANSDVLNKLNEELLKAEEKAAARRVQITARMYSDMDQMGDGYYQAQVALLDQQKAEYGQHVTDKVLLEEWYASEMKNIQEDIRLSNLNAMELYHEELRKDIEETARYSSEKFAEAAMSIEGSMSDAFYSMRKKGADWRDATNTFFNNVGDAFARMAADMLARWAMLQALNIGSFGMDVSGSIFGGIGSLFMHKGWVPEGVPSFQGGRGLKDNEMAAIIEKDELLVPDNKIVKSGVGGGMVIYIDTYIEKVEANDAASFDAQLYRSRETLGDIQIMNVRGNHPVGKIKR